MQLRSAFRPMPLSHPARNRVERRCHGRMQTIDISSEPGPLGQCYWTVARAAAKDPALSAQHGWLVNIYPRKLIFCVHHAVLRLGTGKLLDLTKYPLKAVKKVSFIPSDDPSPRLDPDQPEFIDQICIPLSDAPEVRDYINVGRRQVELRRAIANLPADSRPSAPERAALMRELGQNQRRVDGILAALAR